jgi:ketosteroid isomerase-like protein
VVERVYRALTDRDIDALFELFAPDCVITQDTDAMLEALGDASPS